MAIKRYPSVKDNTISTAYKFNLSNRGTLSNMGSSDILELFAIYGQATSSSLEQSRILIDFPIQSISNDRDAGIIPQSGSVVFKLKLFNAEHNQTTPEKITISARIITRDWNEGSGLDMEDFKDEDASNWLSASNGKQWYSQGGDYLQESRISEAPIDLFYTQYLETGAEGLDIDITPVVEQYIKNIKGSVSFATGSISFNHTYPPTIGQTFTLYTWQGDYRTFMLSNTTGSVGKTIFFLHDAHPNTSSINLITAVNEHLGDYIVATGQGDGTAHGENLTASFSQTGATFYGNTVISSSAHPVTASLTNFTGGDGAINYGFLLKLSGSLEDGSLKKSYYTKKFFARSSHHMLERPTLEAQWDSSISDDRGNIIKSSSLAPASDNLNTIYLYNRRRNRLVDIPDTGSNLLVSLVPSIGSAPVSLAGPDVSEPDTFITASRHSKGIYKARFAYSGTETALRDIWHYTGSDTNGYPQLFTGSQFSVNTEVAQSHHVIPYYVTSITNLKSSYDSSEQVTFRIYTRNKNWKPNIYTSATSTAPVNVIREAYYKIKRVSDDMVVIPYTTGSTPSYSSLSYDISGSYFDLDMSILEPNYLYEISLLYKDGEDYIEQKEKFKFRVD